MMRRRPGAVLSAVVISLTVVGLAAQRRAAPEPPPSAGGIRTNDTTILINSVMPVPGWALAERELLRLNAEGAAFWAQKYLDANGHLRGEPHFGILDGPDDAVETIRNWPLAHALGGPGVDHRVVGPVCGRAMSINSARRAIRQRSWRKTACTTRSFPGPTIGSTSGRAWVRFTGTD